MSNNLPKKTEPYRCSWCGTITEFTFKQRIKEYQLSTHGITVEIWECRKCGFEIKVNNIRL